MRCLLLQQVSSIDTRYSLIWDSSVFIIYMVLSQNNATYQTACDSSILDGLTRFGDMKIQYSGGLRDDCTGLHSFIFMKRKGQPTEVTFVKLLALFVYYSWNSSLSTAALRCAVQREDRLLWTCGSWCGIASWGCNSALQKILFWSRTLSGPVFQIKCWRFTKSVLKRNADTVQTQSLFDMDWKHVI